MTPCRRGPRRSWASGSLTSADSGSLERYLETFAHTVAVMQTTDRFFDRHGVRARPRRRRRGVCRVRFAPELHLEGRPEPRRGSSRRSTPASARARCSLPSRASPSGWPPWLTAIRHAAKSREIAGGALSRPRCGGFRHRRRRGRYPPSRHLDAFEYLQRENARFTIHAGEGFGLPSIWGGDPVVRSRPPRHGR